MATTASTYLAVRGSAPAKRLVDHLRVARGTLRVHQVFRGDARDGFRDAIPVAVVHHGDPGPRLNHVVLEVVHIAQPIRRRGVPVIVVSVCGKLIVRVVVRQPARIPLRPNKVSVPFDQCQNLGFSGLILNRHRNFAHAIVLMHGDEALTNDEKQLRRV
jgi:hypothetical protein